MISLIERGKSNPTAVVLEKLATGLGGVIPGYALLPRGGLCSTTVYYRNLGG